MKVVKAIFVSMLAGLTGAWVGDRVFMAGIAFPSITLLWTLVGASAVLSTAYLMLQQTRTRHGAYLLLLPVAGLVGWLMMPFSTIPDLAYIGVGYALLTYAFWIAAHIAWTFFEERFFKGPNNA